MLAIDPLERKTASAPQRALRIASWNVENLAPFLLPEASGALVRLVGRLEQPEVLCLQEVRLRPVDENLIMAAGDVLPGYQCHLSLNRDARNASHRGGRANGVMTFSRRELRGEPITYAWDLEGRVIGTLIPDMRLAVVNVYAVNGTSKPYWDHDLQAWNGDRHAFKRRFVDRLSRAVAPLQRTEVRLVLIGDWNISRTKLDTWPRLRSEEPHAGARAEFNDRFIPDLDLVDAFRELHPTTCKYTWFNRRARGNRLDAARVDYALVTRSLMPSILQADIDESAEARGRSDHAPLWVDLRIRGC